MKGETERASMVQSRRQQRLASLLQEAMSEIVLRDLHLASDAFVAVSRVEMSGDLKIARIYLRVFGAESPEKILASFEKRKPFIRRTLASRVNIKYNPLLFFAIDPIPEHEEQIDRLIEKIKKHE